MNQLIVFLAKPYRRVVAPILSTVIAISTQSGNTADHRDIPAVALHPGSIVRENVGAGLFEKVDVLLVNDCDNAVEVEVRTTAIPGDSPRGEVAIETLELAHESFKRIPVALPGAHGAIDGRRYVNLDIRMKPGPCTAPGQGLLRAAVAVETVADGTVRRSAGLRSDGELVQASASTAGRKLYVGGLAWPTDDSGLSRIGEGQSAHLILQNHCHLSLEYEVALRVLGAEEQPRIPGGVLEAGGGAIIPLGEGGHDKWIDVLSIDWGTHKPGGASAAVNDCRKVGISASMEVYDTGDGGTRHAQRVRPRGFGFVELVDTDSTE